MNKDDIIIRNYRESDSQTVGKIIAETFSKYNLGFATSEEKEKFLGPFHYAESQEEKHIKDIADTIQASMVFVAECDGKIVGVLRGRSDQLQSLFVCESHHRRGIGRRLCERFETACLLQGSLEIKVSASLYAVPFYAKMGYKKTTGIRNLRIFGCSGFPYQPMKKILTTQD